MNVRSSAAVLLAVLAAACGSATRPPVITPPDRPPTYTLFVHACDGLPCEPGNEPHKVPSAEITVTYAGTGYVEHADGAGNLVRDGLVAGQRRVCAAATGYKTACAEVTLPRPEGQDVFLVLVRDVPPILPVRVEGRFFVTDAGTVRLRFSSALSLLVRSPLERAVVLDQARALGFNGIRVFAGHLGWAGQTPEAARAALPVLLGEAASRGLYVYVCAITGGREPAYDVEAHLRDIAAIVARYPNAILEVANEIGHPSLADKSPEEWLRIARRVIPPGVTWTLGAPVGTDEPTPEGTYPTDGGHFNDGHLDRSRDLYNQVRRLREIYAIAETTRKAAMSGETIGIAEVPMPGKQRLWDDDALRFSYAYGVLCRGFELACVFHSEHGLLGARLGPQTVAAAEAFIAGTKAIPTDARMTFVNAGWAGSPVRAANFDTGIVRAYSFIDGNRGWTVFVGVRGDIGVEWGGGWSPVRVVAERPGIQIVEIVK